MRSAQPATARLIEWRGQAAKLILSAGLWLHHVVCAAGVAGRLTLQRLWRRIPRHNIVRLHNEDEKDTIVACNTEKQPLSMHYAGLHAPIADGLGLLPRRGQHGILYSQSDGIADFKEVNTID